MVLAGPLAAAESMEEIVVTAQKREQTLQEVPIAVSVLPAETIDAAFANGIEELQSLVPSVSFRKGNTTRNSALTVRGIGTISFSIAAEPSVSTVVDGVVLGRSGQAFGDLYDLERIEVLRGPQGTLFGKNASAGLLNITTQRPTDEFDAYVDGSFFQDNEYRLKAKVSGRLGERARGSLTAFRSEFDGYISNTFDNREVNGYDRHGFRGMLEYDLADDLEVLIIAELYDADDDCCADLEGLPSGRNPLSEAAPDSNGVVGDSADIDLNQRRVDHDLTTRTLDESRSFSVQLTKDFGEYTLTSITAQRSWDNTEIREGDFTSIGGTSTLPVFGVPFQLHDVGNQQWEQFSQEIRISSPADRQLFWQAGFFYFDIDSERDFTRDASCQNNGGQNQPILDANPGLTCNANDIVSATGFMSTEFENWALFGQAEYSFTDALSVIVGLRFTDDKVTFAHNRVNNDEFGRQGVGVRPAEPNSQFSAASGGFNSNFGGDTDETDLSGKIAINYAFGEHHSVFGSYSQGYKGPAFNVFYNMGTNDTLPIGAETNDSFEIGYKYTGANLFLGVTLFSMDIEDFQANNFDNSTGVTITRLTNAGDVSTQGIELDLIWTPITNLTISGGLALVDAEIDEFNCPVDPTTGIPPTGCSDRSGLDVPFAPDVKYSIAGRYSWSIGGDTEAFINTSFVYTDEQQTVLPGNTGGFSPVTTLPDYGIWNASVGLSFNDDQFRVSLIGKNLADESFATTYSGDGFRYQIPREADRFFGLNVRANLR
ncbi:MAG: TonB-dependent receptor [Pseudomonadota bacterium]